MIIEQIKNGLVRHYSDAGVKIRQLETGELFNDAINVLPCQFTYEETNIPVDEDELDPEEALDILMGVYNEPF